MDRKLVFWGMALLISLFVLSTPRVWAAMGGSESSAVQSADSEMGAISKDADQQNEEDSLDQASPDDQGLITNDTDGGTTMTQVTSKKTRTVVKETTTSQTPQAASAPKPEPKPQYIK